MFVGILRFDFLIRGSDSLKDKRHVVRSIVGSAQARFKLSVAEVDFQDLRQRGAIGAACVSNSSFQARKVMQEVERFVRSHVEIEIVDVRTELFNPEDELFEP